MSRHAIMVAVAAVVLSGTAGAADITWSSTNNTTGEGKWWGKAGNWSPASVPTSADRAIFSTAAIKTVELSTVGNKNYAAQVGALSFTGTDWLIAPSTDTAGGGSLTLAPNAVIEVATAGSATISGLLAGSAFNKSGSGILTLSNTGNTFGGATISAGTLAMGASNVLPNTSSFTVSGGTLDVSTFSDTVAGLILTSGSITGTTGVLTSTSAYDMRSGSVSAILGGSVGLNKTTTGTVTLSGANTYSGQTSISTGTLLVNGSLSSASAVTVSSGATLGGTGAVGAVTNNGTVSPGASSSSPETLDVTALTLGINSTIQIDMANAGIAGTGNDTNAGSGWDKLTLGSFTRSSAWTVNLSGTPAGMDTYTADNGGTLTYRWLIATVTTGVFDLTNANLSFTGFNHLAGLIGTPTTSLSLSADSKSLYVSYTYSAVPEATSLLLGLVGMTPVVMHRRRTKA